MKKIKSKSATPEPLTSGQFISRLTAYQTAADQKKNAPYFAENGSDKILGIRMKTLFDTAKEFMRMPLKEVEKLFDNPYYEVRMGAVSIMDYRAREKRITETERRELFNLYMDHHDRINNWDMVDRSAPHVVGGYLADKPRAILYKLAKSKNVWERRTAIVSTWFFIRKGDIDDTFNLAELLVNDKHDMIHKAVGSWVREAGKRDKKRLIDFLDRHAGRMPRVMLRYAVEKLDKKQKAFYLTV